jgi:hypothetical protein
MRKQILVLMTAIVFVLALAIAAIAGDPFVGTWKLNLTKSKYYPGPAPKSETRVITSQDNGYKTVSDRVSADGKQKHQEITSTDLDGKYHPVTGQPNFDAAMARKVDANTIVGARKKDGKVVGNIRNVISKDGKTMTLTLKGKNA